jgi:ribonucleoside-diphosphate reductase alpha chain
VSFVLRIASPVAPRERLAEVVRQLDGIGGSRSLGFGPNRVRSLPDGVSRALANYLAEANPVPAGDVESTGAQLEMKLGDLCAECGEAAVVNEEGCRKCYSCGHSEC